MKKGLGQGKSFYTLGIGGSKTQVTRCGLFTFLKVTQKPSIWLTLGLKTNLRPRVSQIEGFNYFPKRKTMICKGRPVECDLCFRPSDWGWVLKIMHQFYFRQLYTHTALKVILIETFYHNHGKTATFMQTRIY